MATSQPAPYDRIEMLAQKLENLTLTSFNMTAQEYMSWLDTRELSIIRTWPRPPADLPMDSGEGVVWVAVIPALYFLVVAMILGALVAFIWYGNLWGGGLSEQMDGGDSTPMSLTVRAINNNNISDSNNNKNNLINSPFIRAGDTKSDTAIDSIIRVRASVTSRGSTGSVDVFSAKPKSAKLRLPFSSTMNSLSGTSGPSQCQGRYSNSNDGIDNKTNIPHHHHHHHLHHHHSRPKPNVQHPINISIASQSFCSDDDDGNFDDSYDNGDRFSRDSLRTSMESQKLLATGVVEIAPDDLYSMSDNTAYADEHDNDKNDNNFEEHQIQRPAMSSYHEICRNSGIENPSFQIEIGDAGDESLFLEDPMGYLVDHSKVLEKQNGGLFGRINNASSASIATNFQTSSIFERKNSVSDSFTSTSSSNREYSQNETTERVIAAFGKNTQTVENGTASSSYRDGCDDAALVRQNYMGHADRGVGRALPPLPPSHYPRQQQLEAPGGPHIQPGQRRELHNGSYSGRRGGGGGDQSIFETSSVLDSSNESCNLSLPSSIARFHASRAQPRPIPRGDFPLTSTRNDTPTLFADWSLCRRHVDAGSASQATPDTFSMCPNRGSFSQSFEAETKPNMDSASGPGQSFLEGSEDGAERDNERNGREVNGSYNLDYGRDDCVRESGRLDDGVKCLDDDKNRLNNEVEVQAVEEEDRPSEVIQSDKNPRMKRMMSLDWLRSGRVSVEKRLRGFGYVKPKGKKTYVEDDELPG